MMLMIIMIMVMTMMMSMMMVMSTVMMCHYRNSPSKIGHTNGMETSI